ncbi:MAG: hypothetical protein ACO2O5_01400 [Candidatus Caldipriscus sp.]
MATFLKVLGNKPWRCAYIEPTRIPKVEYMLKILIVFNNTINSKY